ncbi:MAG TPA: amino acid ABC transporter substrate-binding protein [Clostridiaceae bacterium]|nr:amino acid ABC transporter substrate-binding protein [Clostridiaceae bacterium]
MKKAHVIAIFLICIIVPVFAVYTGIQMFDREFHGSSEDLNYDFNDGDTDETPYDPVAPGDVITVGIYNSGFLYHDEHDHGISKDFVTELFKRMDLKYEIKVMPRARISSMIEEGSLHMGVQSIRTTEREKYAWFVTYFTEKNSVLVRKTANISNEADLLNSRNIKVGIVRGYYYGEYYMDLIEKLKKKRIIVETKDIEELFELLRNDWIQVTFNNPSSYLYYFEKNSIDDIDVIDFDPDGKPLARCLMLSRKYFTEDHVREFERVIDEMKKDGTLYEIFNRYLNEEVSEKACDF